MAVNICSLTATSRGQICAIYTVHVTRQSVEPNVNFVVIMAVNICSLTATSHGQICATQVIELKQVFMRDESVPYQLIVASLTRE